MTTTPTAPREAALRLYAEGHSLSEVAARVGVSKTTVNHWTIAAGISRAPVINPLAYTGGWVRRGAILRPATMPKPKPRRLPTPPGLTCATCQRTFAKQLARTTDSGYIHAECGLASDPGDPPGVIGTPKRRRLNIAIEDVEWMVQTQATLSDACRRLGTNANTLERHLSRAGRSDLYRALSGRERRQGEVA